LKLAKVIILFCLAGSAFSQPDVKYSSVDIKTALSKLNVLGSVLYIAAHPDDENQGDLAYMALERHYQAAYLSLTRGGGGQNLLGPEKGSLLGVIRTQELLAARRIDNAQQFFTRAIDFGYSKSADEALSKWDHNLLLGDVVHVIRQTRPDVIITRFSEKWGGHGHHISSAILAKEAFGAAADARQFPEQLDKLQPWQATRIVWNTWRPQQDNDEDTTQYLSLDLGEYNPLIGMSYREIAAKGRSMHKSQGFGASPERGTSPDYFALTTGSPARSDLFDGIETSWKRIPGSSDIQQSINEIIKDYDPENPQKSIPGLIALYKILNTKKSNYWIETKKKEVQNLLQMCSGLWLESVASNEAASPGDSIEIRTSVLNRSDYPLMLKGTANTYGSDSLYNIALEKDRIKKIACRIQIPESSQYSQPYWLKNLPSETMYDVDKDFRGAAVQEPDMRSRVIVKFADTELTYEIPVLYKWNDPLNGEKYKSFVVRPAVSVALADEVYIFADNQPKQVAITVAANENNLKGRVDIQLPEGWLKEPQSQDFAIDKINEQQTIVFNVTPQQNAQNGEIKAQVSLGNQEYNQQLVTIRYDHIPEQNILVPAIAKIVKLDIIVPPKKIAYIMGSGDEIPESLQQIGLSVDLLSDDDLKSVDYSAYDVVICGVRAFNTRENLEILQERILEYVKNGGVWIVQHNTRFGIQVKQIGPYPYVARGRSRISEEDTPVTILKPAHPLLNFPNKITLNDFKNWVQERGTYLAESWNDNFTPLIAGHDKGEEPQKGGLLYAHYGKGIFIFTGFSWFRQLPAGVPGAYRIFVNMICAGDSSEMHGLNKK